MSESAGYSIGGEPVTAKAWALYYMQGVRIAEMTKALREIEAGPYNGFEQCKAIAHDALHSNPDWPPEADLADSPCSEGREEELLRGTLKESG